MARKQFSFGGKWHFPEWRGSRRKIRNTTRTVWKQFFFFSLFNVRLHILRFHFWQCDQIWRNPPLWQVIKNLWETYLSFIWFWAMFSTHFVTICMLLGTFTVLKMAKYWKHNLVIWSHWNFWSKLTAFEQKLLKTFQFFSNYRISSTLFIFLVILTSIQPQVYECPPMVSKCNDELDKGSWPLC